MPKHIANGAVVQRSCRHAKTKKLLRREDFGKGQGRREIERMNEKSSGLSGLSGEKPYAFFRVVSQKVPRPCFRAQSSHVYHKLLPPSSGSTRREGQATHGRQSWPSVSHDLRVSSTSSHFARMKAKSGSLCFACENRALLGNDAKSEWWAECCTLNNNEGR